MGGEASGMVPSWGKGTWLNVAGGKVIRSGQILVYDEGYSLCRLLMDRKESDG